MSDFVHLHVHTDFSLLDGMAKIKPLVARAKELGMPALAITDHGNMCGVIHFEKACIDAGIKPIIGCEFYVAGGSRLHKTGTEEGNRYYHLILLAKNEAGYRNLVRLTSYSWTEGFYYKPRIDTELIERYKEGIICLSACIAGELPQLLLAGKKDMALQLIDYYKQTYGEDSYFIEIQNHALPEEKRVSPLLVEIARETNTPLVVTNDSHYIMQDDWEAHEILTCVGFKTTLDDPKHTRHYEGYATKQYWLKSEEEMAALFPELPDYAQIMANTKRVADMCEARVIPRYEVSQLKECLPAYGIPPEFDGEVAYIRHLVDEGLSKRYGTITEKIKERADYELDTIIKMGFVGYFLIVWDFINWAKTNDIPIGPGRGSGAGSIVAYAMGITNIDPLRYGLFFERFLNPERVSMPDFDIDISDEGRQQVIEYTRQKYGEAQVGHIVTFGTLKARAVIKDVGRVLGIPATAKEAAEKQWDGLTTNDLAKLVPESPKVHLKDAFEVAVDDSGKPKFDNAGQLAAFRSDSRYKKLFDICFKLEDVHRNTSLHASGIVIGKSALPEWAPILTVKDRESKDDRYLAATQYTMDIVEPCGLVKMDYLGLKALSIIKRASELIRKQPGHEDFDIEKIDEHCDKAFDFFCEGKTAAFFQFESPGMSKVLIRAKPRKVEELIALNALYRPGPMQFIDQFIESKFDNSKIKYPDPSLKDILEETYGVIVYQEQVMQVAQKIAGYSLGGADQLRRAMGKKKAEEMAKHKKIFIDGAVKKGFDEKHADEIFEILVPFAGYGFNKSHAAAYAIIAYQTAYLKANFPVEFFAANLTNEIYGKTETLAVYIEEARNEEIKVLPPDINTSGVIFEAKDGFIPFGLCGIKGMGELAAQSIISERETNGPYKSFIDFLLRVDSHTVNKTALEGLIKTGAFDKLGQNRATLMANLTKAIAFAARDRQDKAAGQANLFEAESESSGNTLDALFEFDQAADWTFAEKLEREKELVGCFLSGHPLDPYKKIIARSATVTTDSAVNKCIHIPSSVKWNERKSYVANLPRQILIGEIKSVKEITTKKGELMAFCTLTDFAGDIELTVFPDYWKSIKDSAQPGSVVALSGIVDTKDDKISFQAEKVLDINALPEKKRREVHIRLNGNAADQDDALEALREHLIENTGSCEVYIHLPAAGRETVMRATSTLSTSSDAANLSALERCAGVASVWSV